MSEDKAKGEPPTPMQASVVELTGSTSTVQDAAAVPSLDSGETLRRNISIRHMVFIALGGSIGAGLFVGSGGALSAGGPLSLVLNFAIVGFGVTCTMGSLGELAGRFSSLFFFAFRYSLFRHLFIYLKIKNKRRY